MTRGKKRPPAAFPADRRHFLGVGKTSLLNAVLRDPALAGTLVIVNEPRIQSIQQALFLKRSR
ncbi:MAG: GTP-binding protein [Methylocella sp.]